MAIGPLDTESLGDTDCLIMDLWFSVRAVLKQTTLRRCPVRA